MSRHGTGTAARILRALARTRREERALQLFESRLRDDRAFYGDQIVDDALELAEAGGSSYDSALRTVVQLAERGMRP